MVQNNTMECREAQLFHGVMLAIAAFSILQEALSVKEIIEYYGARWKIEACFKDLKRDIGSAETQTRNSVAVTSHLEFCMMATTLTWVYACRPEKT
ncbi:MAG: transposase, partial [Desulfuromusa sp.]|nr:transposase [Desulfuromusa sp.]